MRGDTAAQAEERRLLIARVEQLSDFRRAYPLGRLVAATPVPVLRECLGAAEAKLAVGFGQSAAPQVVTRPDTAVRQGATP